MVVASELLARACFEEGLYPQCYSIFGGERRGAPVAAFVRVADERIYLKCDIERPNHLVMFDPSLFTEQQIREQVVQGGLVLFNSDTLQKSDLSQDYKVCGINALQISKGNGLGSIVNTAVLGAYVGITKIVNIDSLLKTIRENIPAAIDQNVTAAREAYDKVFVP